MSRSAFSCALKKAGTVTCEPISSFLLELPKDLLGWIYSVLGRHGASPRSPVIGSQTAVIEGLIPAAMVQGLMLILPHFSRGEASFETSFDYYEPVLAPSPCRQRTDNDPLNRRAYFISLGKRV
jgi:ribosomal protection tetracycline resistance protein